MVNSNDLRMVLGRLKINNVFILMLYMVEEVMGLRFDNYKFGKIPQEDVVAIFHLIMERDKYFVPLIERDFRSRFIFYFTRYRQFSKLIKYLPISRLKFVSKSVKELLSITVRQLFHISEKDSYSSALKNKISRDSL